MNEAQDIYDSLTLEAGEISPKSQDRFKNQVRKPIQDVIKSHYGRFISDELMGVGDKAAKNILLLSDKNYTRFVVEYLPASWFDKIIDKFAEVLERRLNKSSTKPIILPRAIDFRQYKFTHEYSVGTTLATKPRQLIMDRDIGAKKYNQTWTDTISQLAQTRYNDDKKEAEAFLTYLILTVYTAHEMVHGYSDLSLPVAFKEYGARYYTKKVAEGCLEVFGADFFEKPRDLTMRNKYAQLVEKYGDDVHKLFFGTLKDSRLKYKILAQAQSVGGKLV